MRDVAIVGAGPAGLESRTRSRLPRSRRSSSSKNIRRSAFPFIAPACSASTRSPNSTSRASACSAPPTAPSSSRPTAAPWSWPPTQCGPWSSIARASINRLPTRAVQAGAELRAGARVRSITVESAHVGVDVRRSAGRFTRAHALLACGASYRLQPPARARRAASVRAERAARAAVRRARTRRGPSRPRGRAVRIRVAGAVHRVRASRSTASG